jgi:hypothetical protein
MYGFLGGMYYLHFQDQRVSEQSTRKKHEAFNHGDEETPINCH